MVLRYGLKIILQNTASTERCDASQRNTKIAVYAPLSPVTRLILQGTRFLLSM